MTREFEELYCYPSDSSVSQDLSYGAISYDEDQHESQPQTAKEKSAS